MMKYCLLSTKCCHRCDSGTPQHPKRIPNPLLKESDLPKVFSTLELNHLVQFKTPECGDLLGSLLRPPVKALEEGYISRKDQAGKELSLWMILYSTKLCGTNIILLACCFSTPKYYDSRSVSPQGAWNSGEKETLLSVKDMLLQSTERGTEVV